MSSKPCVRFLQNEFEGLDSKTREAEWDKRYKSLDIASEQRERIKNIEYLEIFDRYLGQSLSDFKRSSESTRVLELACGAAPFTKRSIERGAVALASDYSEVITKRLSEEFGYKTARIDLWNIDSSVGEFDIIVLAGGIYESADYTLPKRAYASLKELLSEDGIIIQFLNRYDNIANRMMILNATLRRLLSPKNNNLIRKAFGKKRLKTTHSFWLMPISYVCECGILEGLELESVVPMELSNGILDATVYGLYPFRFFPFKDPYAYSQDGAERYREVVFNRLFLNFVDFLFRRKKLRLAFSKSACIVFSKKLNS